MSRTTNAAAVSTIGIDTGKNTLHLIGLDEQGMIVLREKLTRGRIGGRLANVSPCLIGIEAGMGTHYVARELISLGHDVRQVPPAYAKPFRQTHKNDFRDAYAIAEAVRRPSTRCVPVKTDDQGLSENEIGCARISMMARSKNAPFTGRIQKRKTNHLHPSYSTCNTRPVHTVGSSATVFRLPRHVRYSAHRGLTSGIV
jgi:Transposase